MSTQIAQIEEEKDAIMLITLWDDCKLKLHTQWLVNTHENAHVQCIRQLLGERNIIECYLLRSTP